MLRDVQRPQPKLGEAALPTPIGPPWWNDRAVHRPTVAHFLLPLDQ